MKRLVVIICLFTIIINAQNIKELENVPKEFKTKYFENHLNFCPLHVGDIWEYTFIDYPGTTKEIRVVKIIKDTLVNNKRYFKKVNWMDDSFISWERCDSNNNSFILDYQDIDEDGDSTDELPLDSLNLPNNYRYLSYKYSFKTASEPIPGQRTALLKDSAWVEIFGDTVLFRRVEYLEIFWIEEIAEKYGTIKFMWESPESFLTGAIIDGKQYGTLVSVFPENDRKIPSSVKLFNNYPNPFNPSTIISYSIPTEQKVILEVYDVMGRKVRELIDKVQKRGKYKVAFNSKGLSSGVYFFTLKTQKTLLTKRMLLIK